MQPHPQRAHKERLFLPGFKRPGLPGPFSVAARRAQCVRWQLRHYNEGPVEL